MPVQTTKNVISPVSWQTTSATTQSVWLPTLTGGPYWASFEKLRTAGGSALEGLKPGAVGTLQTKAGQFRIVRDDDFQRLLGLASEVHRLKGGIKILVKAAKVVAMHPDQDTVEMLIQTVSMLNESSILPEKDGHDHFELTQDEIAGDDGEDIDVSEIRRPNL